MVDIIDKKLTKRVSFSVAVELFNLHESNLQRLKQLGLDTSLNADFIKWFEKENRELEKKITAKEAEVRASDDKIINEDTPKL